MRYHRLGIAMAVIIMAAAPASAEYVTSSTLNCRSAPTLQASIVARLARNDEVRVLAWSGDWARVEPARVSPCWVATRYLGDTPSAYSSAGRPAGSGERPEVGTRPGVARSSGVRPAPRQSYGQPPRRAGSSSSSRPRRASPAVGGACPCSGSRVCIGPRGGRYCITSGGNRRYGV